MKHSGSKRGRTKRGRTKRGQTKRGRTKRVRIKRGRGKAHRKKRISTRKKQSRKLLKQRGGAWSGVGIVALIVAVVAAGIWHWGRDRSRAIFFDWDDTLSFKLRSKMEKLGPTSPEGSAILKDEDALVRLMVNDEGDEIYTTLNIIKLLGDLTTAAASEEKNVLWYIVSCGSNRGEYEQLKTIAKQLGFDINANGEIWFGDGTKEALPYNLEHEGKKIMGGGSCGSGIGGSGAAKVIGVQRIMEGIPERNVDVEGVMQFSPAVESIPDPMNTLKYFVDDDQENLDAIVNQSSLAQVLAGKGDLRFRNFQTLKPGVGENRRPLLDDRGNPLGSPHDATFYCNLSDNEPTDIAPKKILTDYRTPNPEECEEAQRARRFARPGAQTEQEEEEEARQDKADGSILGAAKEYYNKGNGMYAEGKIQHLRRWAGLPAAYMTAGWSAELEPEPKPPPEPEPEPAPEP